MLTCWYCDVVMASDPETFLHHELSEKHAKWKAIAQAVLGMMEGKVTVDMLREKYRSLVVLADLAQARAQLTGCDDYAKIIFDELEPFLKQHKAGPRKSNSDELTVNVEVNVSVKES